MNVLMLSPGFPAEMPLFTRGLREVGAQIIGKQGAEISKRIDIFATALFHGMDVEG